MAEKSKILIIGATGYIGKYITEASIKAGHPTFALIRATTVSDPQNVKLIESFNNSGIKILQGDIYDHESLVKAIKQVDVVISTVGIFKIADQVKIIAAIKEAGTVKRFFPSEFGNDSDSCDGAVEPAATVLKVKSEIRRAVEAEGIPYTYVCSYRFAGFRFAGSFFYNFGQMNATAPPRDEVVILGDGISKVIVVKEEDIATYTIKAVDDPRTLNKILYIKPPANICSFNDIVSMWEKKIGKALEKIHIPEEQLLKKIHESPYPLNVMLGIGHSVYIKGDNTRYEIDPSIGVEASELYPDVKYTTMDEYLDQLV